MRGEHVQRLWHPEDASGLSRKDRAPGRYLCYVPDELGDSLPTLGAEAQGASEDALAVLARADERIGARGRYLIRSESVSSSWIEGNRVTPKRLAIAELLHQGPRHALDEWVIGFAQAAEKAARNAVRLADDIAALDQDVYDRLVAFRRDRGRNPAVPCRDAVVLRILDPLASDPVLTAESVSTRLAVSPAAAHRAPADLAEAGILGRTKEQLGRLVCWTADRHLALTERSNRVGGGDTPVRKPRLGPALPDVSQFGARRQASTARRNAPGL